jgi:hypothetical protein
MFAGTSRGAMPCLSVEAINARRRRLNTRHLLDWSISQMRLDSLPVVSPDFMAAWAHASAM